MRTSDNPGALFEALAKAQADFTVAKKSKTAKVTPKDQTQAGYSYTYATMADVIESVRPALKAAGLVVVQWPVFSERFVTIVTRLCLGPEFIECDFTISLPSYEKSEVAKATTAASRLALRLFLVVAVDEEEEPPGDRDARPQNGQRGGGRNWGPPPGAPSGAPPADAAPPDRSREYAQLDALCCQIADRSTTAMGAVNTILTDLTGGSAKPSAVPAAKLREAFARLRELEKISRPTTPSQATPAQQEAAP